MNTLDPERRQQMVEAIAVWLNDLTEAEPPPPGLAPEIMGSSEPAPDLFSVLSQLAALTRETQLQGRATNRLHAELGAALNRLPENASSPEAIASKLAEARREARLELVTELLEVRDRLARGLAEARGRLDSLRAPGPPRAAPRAGGAGRGQPPGPRPARRHAAAARRPRDPVRGPAVRPAR